MMRFTASIMVLLGCSSFGYADTFPAASDMAGLRYVHMVVGADGRKILVIDNANSCAPFEASAVWSSGPAPKLLGYHCYNNPNKR